MAPVPAIDAILPKLETACDPVAFGISCETCPAINGAAIAALVNPPPVLKSENLAPTFSWNVAFAFNASVAFPELTLNIPIAKAKSTTEVAPIAANPEPCPPPSSAKLGMYPFAYPLLRIAVISLDILPSSRRLNTPYPSGLFWLAS